MKKILLVFLTVFMLVGCSSKKIEPDMTSKEAEIQLNEGKDIVGKKIAVTVVDFKPASAFGYNIIDGEHLNFVSPNDPKIEVNDEVIVTVTEVKSILGSFVISYKDLVKVK